MELNGVKEAALLSWINSVCPEEPINKITQMMDGHRLLDLAYRVLGKEPSDGLFLTQSPNMMEILFSILQADFQLSPRQASIMLQKIRQGIELELQIAKVVLVLCYCGFTKHNMVPLDVKTGLMIASMFRFIEDDADGLSLHDDLNKFLTKAPVMTFSTSSSESSCCCSPLYTEFPNISPFQEPARVQFQELVTVACSSVRSPVQDVMSTPQLVNRLRKELAHGREMRNALEKELANQINIISEKEGLIIQLQHRVDRMLREQQELEKDHKAALLELQEKNESLLCRVHEVLKQCRDLKAENRQKEREMHELMEENQPFSAQVQNAFAQLERAEEGVANLTLAHETSQAEWRIRKEFLEHEHKALNKIESVESQEQAQEFEKIIRELQAEISALSSERDTQINALKTEMKDQQLKSNGLRAQLELKLEKKKTGFLTLKNLAQQWEQKTKELLENQKLLFKKLQHYSSKYQESQKIRKSLERALQMERDQTKAKVDFEKRLQEWRKVIDDDEDVRCRESIGKLESCISRTATVESRHANRLSNSQPKRRQSVMFVIANTPKRSRGGSLLRRGLKLREDSCKTPTVGSHGLRPVSSANSRSQVSAVKNCPRNKSSKPFNDKPVKSRIICGQTLDLFLSAIILFVYLFTLLICFAMHLK